MTLAALFDRYGTDKLGHGYAPYYERHLGYLRKVPFTLLEIGVYQGASLKAWADYFEKARIVGIDIQDHGFEVTSDRMMLIIGDVKNFITAPDPLDVVIDDGSHKDADVIVAVHRLWPHVPPGGWYVIEDCDTRTPGDMVEQLIATTIQDLYHERPTDVGELHIYPQIVFLHKRS